MTDIPITDPVQAVAELARGLWRSRALWLAAHLGLADHVGPEPTAIDEIAGKTGVQSAMLSRLMHALTACAVFAHTSDGKIIHSELSEVLRSDHPAGLRAYIDCIFGGEQYAAWGGVADTLRTGRTAFDSVHGQGLFEHHATHPAAGRLFADAMSSTTAMIEASLLSAYEFTPFVLAVDLGGSQGSLLRRILAKHSAARGVVFDIPEVIAAARSASAQEPESDRIEFLSGDFFEEVPVAAELYLLKLILHDWTDAECTKILHNVRRAISANGRLVIVEMVLPDDLGPHPGWLRDLQMMVLTGGKERTREQYRNLLSASGFRLLRVVMTGSLMSVIEAEPV